MTLPCLPGLPPKAGDGLEGADEEREGEEKGDAYPLEDVDDVDEEVEELPLSNLLVRSLLIPGAETLRTTGLSPRPVSGIVQENKKKTGPPLSLSLWRPHLLPHPPFPQQRLSGTDDGL